MWMLWLVSLGCTGGDVGSDDTAQPRMTAPRPHREGPVWVAPVVRAHQAAPSWVGADLPSSPRALTDEPRRWPTWGHYAQRVCAGIDTTRARWRLRLLGPDGPAWAELAQGCPSADLCVWLKGHATRAKRPLSEGLVGALRHCEGGTESADLEAAQGLPWARWPWRRGMRLDHEATLGQLAALAGLRGVAFRAEPAHASVSRMRAFTTLYAWYDGQRSRALVVAGDPGSALEQHVGLLNVILADRGWPERLAVIDPSGNDTFVVVIASEDRLQELHDEGQLMLPPHSVSRPPQGQPLPSALDTGFPSLPELSGEGAN